MDLTIVAALVIVLISVFIFYYLQKNLLKTKELPHVSKPASKEELLLARVKHFQGVKDASPKTESKVHQPSLQRPCPELVGTNLTKQETSKELNHPDMHTSSAEVLLISSYTLGSNSNQPESRPIKTLPELLSWIPGYEEFSIGKLLRRPIARDGTKPKTLICHDMKGGYIEDRFVQGYNSEKCFRFKHWNLIDSFCYFSHSFVTIPPPCWINAAHNHGVKMLGTVITEWDDGAAICAEIFQSTAHVEKVVKVLVDIANYYQFDGWLINIENPIDPNKIDNVQLFLSRLTDLMHTKITESEVIWYDSVTKSGELKWQNKLCDENKMFFDACDGIFLNYNWSINDLQSSLQISRPNRQHDVYVGVDVFGRGCFGGGGWNTYKAMNVIREQKLSAAIFAPGWIMETLEIDQFTENDEKFWRLLRTYLYSHCVSTLPFVSTFCQGYGNKIFVCGQEISTSAWTNLSATSIQPSFSNNFYQLGPYDGMEIYMKTSEFSTDFGFNGGGSYVINGMVKPCAKQTKTVFRFFDTKISLKVSKEYFLSYSFQCSTDKVEVFTLLLFEGRPNYLLFMPPTHVGSQTSVKYTIPATQEGNYLEIYPIDDECISCYAEFSTAQDWTTRNYKFSLEKPLGLLKEIRLACTSGGIVDEAERTDFTVKVGEIRIHNLADVSVKIPTAVNLKCQDVNIRSDGEKKWISFTLSWDIVIEKGYALPKCFDIFCSGQCNQEVSCNSANGCIQTINNEEYGIYVGRTYTNYYYVSNLIVPSQCTGTICLIVQGISYAEIRQNRCNAGTITLRW